MNMVILEHRLLGYCSFGKKYEDRYEDEDRFKVCLQEERWSLDERSSFIEDVIRKADLTSDGILSAHEVPQVILQEIRDRSQQVGTDFPFQSYDVLKGFQCIRTIQDFFFGKLPIPKTLENLPRFAGIEPCAYDGAKWLGTRPTLPQKLSDWILQIQYPVKITSNPFS